MAALRDAAGEFGFPVFLKPETSSRLPNPFARQKVNRARNTVQLERYGAAMLPYGPVLVQQDVSGIGAGVEFLSREGEILTAIQHERVHETPGGGRSGYRRSVGLDPGMYHAAELLARALRYTGRSGLGFPPISIRNVSSGPQRFPQKLPRQSLLPALDRGSSMAPCERFRRPA